MKIREHYYNEENESLYVEFSADEDGDDFYRILELEYWNIEYYSPDIITKSKVKRMSKDYLIEVITEYLKSNELPEQQTL